MWSTRRSGLAVELWFKAATGGTGVLMSMQNADLSAVPSHYTPLLYVDTAGKLRGKFWTTTSASGA